MSRFHSSAKTCNRTRRRPAPPGAGAGENPEHLRDEPDPPERLLEVAPEGLLVKSAEASKVREIDPSAQREHRFEQLPQKLALPETNLAIANVSHFPEHGGHHRREKRLSKLRP